ncbi:MAG: hypothetical protein L0211_10115 [Planctomycetaceae bacterium]|nr:hypothetical protein [Planctomycetaceae bacterium]
MSRLLAARPALAYVLGLAVLSSAATAADLLQPLAKIRAVAAEGKGHGEAVAAAKALAQAEASDLPQILAAMDGANPIATNWLRVAAESVAQRATLAGKLPKADLEKFLAETKHSPRGRRLAYELVAGVDPTAEQRLIPTLLDDPSLELRRDAVAQLLATAAKSTEKPKSIELHKRAFRHARDLDQIKSSSAKLKELGQSPDIAAHMGFVLQWKLIGPFDNIDDRGWDVAYPPEKVVELSAELEGQKGKVRWLTHVTADEFGRVDLNKVLANHKGAIAYAYVEFVADREQPCDLRMGTSNASKVWLNGELIGATHVYHANELVDQYIAKGTLKRGRNTILLKLCQNEQTEVWAQDWAFQLRVCDAIGTAILAQDRPGQKVALRFK